MKKYIYIAPALLAASSLMLTSCNDEAYYLEGSGTISVKAALSGDVKVASRADADELRQLYGESLELWLTKPGQGPVRRYEGIDNLPTAPVTMPAGQYVAEAWAGDSVSASFDAKYFKGFLPFEVTKGTSTPVDVTLKIANVVVSVDVDESVDNVLREGYTLNVSHPRGELTFEGRDERKGYFMMPSASKDLTLTLSGTGLDGKPYTQTEIIENAQPATEYIIHIKHNPKGETSIGGGYFTISIDASEIDVDDRFVLTLAPDIRGVGFDIARTQTLEKGKGERKSVYVSATDELTSLIIEGDALANIFADHRTSCNLVTAGDATYEQALAEAGITVKRVMTDGVLTNMRVNFEDEFTNTLPEGTYTFTFTAADGDLTSSATLTLDVTDAPVAIQPVDDKEVSYTSVTLRATVLKVSRSSDAGFRYRRAGVGSWEFAEGTITGNEMVAEVTGLSQNTAYEYTAVYGSFETAPLSFTTIAYPQLTDAGFENWQTSSHPYLIYAAGGQMFWDSGNHGSATMGKSITTPDSSIKHSGKYSAKLASTFVGIGTIGKLAAGNIFTGEYLGTDGTDGILGWGRPFTAPERPKALKGYVKYSPVAVTHANTNPGGLAKKDMDQGIIYIALLADTPDPREDNQGWPVVIRTKTKQLFDQNASNVIAYGEQVFTSATPGDGMIEFTIDLSDVHADLTMGRILVVASASRYGDYFTGGNGSTMWIDDFELVY